MSLLWRALVLAIALSLPTMVQAGVGVLTDAEAQRYHTLTEQLRCLVCQNQSIATSDAELAADLRARVALQIRAGRTDAEIRRFMADRYGDWVLYRPPFNGATWALWLAPVALLLTGIGCIVRLFGKRSSSVGRRMGAGQRARLSAIVTKQRRDAADSSSTHSSDEH